MLEVIGSGLRWAGARYVETFNTNTDLYLQLNEAVKCKYSGEVLVSSYNNGMDSLVGGNVGVKSGRVLVKKNWYL